MAKKRTSAAAPKDDLLNSSAAPSSTALEPSSTDRSSSSFPASLSPPVKINNASLSEVKTALDDAIRNCLNSSPNLYSQSHHHTDVKLAMGWSACIIALATTGWSTRVDWETSKLPLTFAVGSYMLLSLLQMLYSSYIERDNIYIGKKKSFSQDGRIETSHINISSETSLSPPLRKPIYSIQISSSRSTNAGKSLLERFKKAGTVSVGEFISEKGEVDVVGVERWVQGLLSSSHEKGEGAEGRIEAE